MGECDICHKKMPKAVLEAHKRKRHEIVEILPREEVKSISNESLKCDCPCKQVERCASCGDMIPSFVMPYHARIKHGV